MKPLRVIIGCEKSGVIRRAFRALGHEAYSCDLQPADDGSEFHYQCDVLQVIASYRWDLGIFHPVCTRLANSGVLRLYRDGKKRNGFDPAKLQEMQEAADFFLRCYNARIPHVCVENPIQHCHAKALIGVEPTQIIQPHEFGDDASKATCLWLRNLPRLCVTHVENDLFAAAPPSGRLVNGRKLYANQTDSGQNRLGPSPDRAAKRAETYGGIAGAMAVQWSFALTGYPKASKGGESVAALNH